MRRWITLYVQMWTWTLVITWAWRSSTPCLAPCILTSVSLVKKTSPMNAGLSHRPIFLKTRGTFITQGPYLGGPCQRLTNSPRPAMRWWWSTRPVTSRPCKMMRTTWTNIRFIPQTHQDPLPWVHVGWTEIKGCLGWAKARLALQHKED